MKTSPDGIAKIQVREGTRLVAYQDTKGVWTIGTGHTGGVQPGQKITLAQAAELLAADLGTAEACVSRLVKPQLKQCEFDALVSFTFNVGVGNFARSNVLAHVNRMEMVQAATALLDWDEVGGKFDPAILNRRKAERSQFIGGPSLAAPPPPAPAPDPTDGQADVLNARFDVA